MVLEVKRMTNEEAIELLQNVAWLGSDNGTYVYEALEMAIKALEKQIPKKAVKSNMFHEIGFCPNCNEPIRSRTCFKSTVGKIYISWCSECGQAVDWREEEVNE